MSGRKSGSWNFNHKYRGLGGKSHGRRGGGGQRAGVRSQELRTREMGKVGEMGERKL
jgi:hypothetical protein